MIAVIGCIQLRMNMSNRKDEPLFPCKRAKVVYSRSKIFFLSSSKLSKYLRILAKKLKLLYHTSSNHNRREALSHPFITCTDILSKMHIS
ncbi:hypothetical protein JTE90_002710 [Oedothorax gibbosus]|uniref:Uncharacterized protein n=1 Tax=Oedothorax gibbosus TaxID=931172 RepID=A0AAV6VZ86_9ARAC|nr:hypothetical protein JTE90_002710 [Oedothorax gibbosus]